MHSPNLTVLNTLKISAHRGDPQFDGVTANSERLELLKISITVSGENWRLHSALKILRRGSCLHTCIRPNTWCSSSWMQLVISSTVSVLQHPSLAIIISGSRLVHPLIIILFRKGMFCVKARLTTDVLWDKSSSRTFTHNERQSSM